MAKSARDFFNRVANREKSIPRTQALAACRYSQVRVTAGATGSDHGTTRWCCARPRRSSSTGALASMTSARAPIVSRVAGRPRIEPGNRHPTCLVDER